MCSRNHITIATDFRIVNPCYAHLTFYVRNVGDAHWFYFLGRGVSSTSLLKSAELAERESTLYTQSFPE